MLLNLKSCKKKQKIWTRQKPADLVGRNEEATDWRKPTSTLFSRRSLSHLSLVFPARQFKELWPFRVLFLFDLIDYLPLHLFIGYPWFIGPHRKERKPFFPSWTLKQVLSLSFFSSRYSLFWRFLFFPLRLFHLPQTKTKTALLEDGASHKASYWSIPSLNA